MEQKEKDCGITFIDTGYLRDNFAASHFMIEKGKVATVDVGTANSVKRLVHALHMSGLKEEDVLYVIVTHIHLDHAGGAGQLMKVFPNASLVVHPKGARHMINPGDLIAGVKAVYGEEKYEKLYGDIIPVDPERIIEAAEGFVLNFEGRELHFMDTPGHARHHFCIWDPKSRGVFTGDTLGIAYPELQIPGKRPFLVCTTSPSAFEPDAMIESIERIEALNPSTLFLTHFGPIGVEKESIGRLKRMILEHKELGQQYGTDHAQLVQEIQRIFHTALKEYLDGTDPDEKQLGLLKGDVEMNARGISVWAKRQNQHELAD